MANLSLSLHGVEIRVPNGWEAEIGWAGGMAPNVGSQALAAGPAPSPRVLVHLANFVLPTQRGDYGSGVVERLDGNGIFVSILEFAPAPSGGVFAASDLPTRIRATDFSPDALQRRLPGQAGLQRFFVVGQRRFVLYVVIGSHRLRQVLAPEVGRLLRSISIS